MIATIAEGDERELLWNQIVSDFPNYGSYQEKQIERFQLSFSRKIRELAS